jgi:molybdopterin converting factor subunit 1
MLGVTIRLLFFAILRDITGKEAATIEVAEGTTAAGVWNILREEHSALSAWRNPPMVAVNEEYAKPDRPLTSGDELAFIPPVAGG